MILFSFLPAFLLIIFICKRSPVNVSKVWMAKAFTFGIVSAILAALLEYVLGYIHEEYLWYVPVLGPMYEAFVVAAIPEECCKLLMLWIIIDQYPFVDGYADCLLFSVAVGLGFAAIENMFYVAEGGSSWLAIALIRGLISVPGHYAFAVLMGFFYSLYYFGEERFKQYRWLILVAPIIAHGIFDVLLMQSNQVNDAIKSILLIVFFGFVVRLHKYSQLKLKSLFQRDIDTDHIELFREVMLKRKNKKYEN